MIQIKKLMITLVALLAVTTQAWAQSTYIYEKEDVTIAPSKYYQCTLTMTKTAGPY
jgi:hypothetical protein